MTGPIVVVVGAGVIGLACALRLLERGARVTLIESDEERSLTTRTSQAAAGMLGPLSEAAHQPANGHARAGELALASFDLWRGAALWSAAGAMFNGAVIVGEEAARAAAYAKAVARPAARLSRVEAHARYDIELAAIEAVFLADEGVVDPHVALQAMAARVRELGGAIVFDAEAARIVRDERLHVVGFDAMKWDADAIVLATGVWARDALRASAPALGLLTPAAGTVALARLKQQLNVNVRGDGFYLAARGGRDAVLGASMTLDRTDRRPDLAAIDALFVAAEHALPAQVSRTAQPPWAGVRPMSLDWAPMIGPSGPEGCFVACGHARNGWLLAPVTAEIVCGYVFGDAIPPLWAAFHPNRFETKP